MQGRNVTKQTIVGKKDEIVMAVRVDQKVFDVKYFIDKVIARL